jgi:hypothetical protein
MIKPFTGRGASIGNFPMWPLSANWEANVQRLESTFGMAEDGSRFPIPTEMIPCRDSPPCQSCPAEKSFRGNEHSCSRTFGYKRHLEDHKLTHRIKEVFSCDKHGCSKTFNRYQDLRRHKINHHPHRQFSCPAVDCDRVGANGFPRQDKLKDHMLAGHNDETTFTCPGKHRCPCTAGPGGAPIVLTRDLISIHASIHKVPRCLMEPVRPISGMNDYRACPLPRCPKRFFLDKGDINLDNLQLHLREKHERLGRDSYAGLLRNRGYDAVTTDIVCPVCDDRFAYPGHQPFYRHLLDDHCPTLDTSALSAEMTFHPTNFRTHDRNRTFYEFKFPENYQAPSKLPEHRRTILSLWPAFAWFPVWDDITSKN